MKVLVWRSHGEIDVYAADTAEQIEAINCLIIECAENYGIDEDIDLATKHMDKHKGNRAEMIRAFNTLRNAVGPSYDNDAFEDIFLTDLQEA
jgi:hypothetical protein